MCRRERKKKGGGVMFMFISLTVGVCNVDGWTCLQIQTIRYDTISFCIVWYCIVSMAGGRFDDI